MTNCVNCSAPLYGNKCAYCGTTYSGEKIYADFSQNDFVGRMKLGDREINVYIGHMEAQIIPQTAYRDGTGDLQRKMQEY